MKTIRDIVSGRDVVAVDPVVPVAEAARIMAARHIGAVPVVDAKRLVGIFTERDALVRIVAAGVDPSRAQVRDVMSTSLVVADVGESCESCLNRMREAHIRHLIVLDGDQMAGIVSMRDLMAHDLDDKVETITLLNAYMHSIPGDGPDRRA
jgi:CBS domain-containing protein